MVLGRQGPLAKAVTGALGLTQEYRADKKARKESEGNAGRVGDDSSQPSSSKPPGSGYNSEDSEDDEAWAQDLDAAQAEVSDQKPKKDEFKSVDELVANLTESEPPPPPYSSTGPSSGQLENPVILPQRRPGMRTRGFVRGYAPTLQSRAVTQDGWLKFLNGFDAAISNNRWFFVLNIAVVIADHVRLALEGVSLIAKAVSTAVQLSIEFSRRSYMHAKQNTYLDKLNESYFKPRGLYALVIKYKPKKHSSDHPSDPIELVDIQANIADTVTSRQAAEGSFWKGVMKGSAAKTKSEDLVPEFAPLTFPYLDDLDEAQKKSAMKQKGAFLTDYYDRRAQATFAADNPDSKLSNVAPRKEFVSEYADPTNPKESAGLLSTVSGGYLDPSRRMKARRAKLGIGGPTGEGFGERRAKKKSSRPIKKVLRQDALYLMVVDLPSEQEMVAVREAFEKIGDEQ